MHVWRGGARTWSATVAVFAVVALIFGGLYYGARGLEADRTQAEFEAAAAARVRAVTYALRSDLRLLSFTLVDIQGLVTTRVSTRTNFQSILSRELRIFAGQLMLEEKDVTVISVLLRVPQDTREAFEGQAREQIAATFKIYEIDDTGAQVPVAGPDDKLPIVATLPTERASSLLGFDPSSLAPLREVLDTARDKATMVASTPLELKPGSAPAVWIAGPFYRTDPIPVTTETRRQELAGFVLMGLRLDGLFDEALAGLYPSGIDLRLEDVTETDGPRLLAHHASRKRTSSVTAEELEGAGNGLPSQTEEIAVADRVWRLTATPAPAFFSARPLWPTRIILAVGLVLAVVSAVLVRFTVSRRLQIERTVDERTQALTREIEERARVEAQLKTTEANLVARIADLDRRAAEFLLLNQMGEMMQRCATTEEALSVIARFGQELFPLDTGTLYRFDESMRTVERATGWGGDETTEPLFAVDRCWGLRGGTPHAVENPARDLRCPHVDPQVARDTLCLPLAAQGQTIGLLHLASPRGVVAPPLSTRRRLAVTVADQVSPALANIRLREILREQSVRDPLTGLYNRRYMDETIRQAMHRARRAAAPLCFLMIDIDHFKRFNDEHGHETGDAILRLLGAFLRGALRESDTPCRYGGEEFAVILPDATAETGRQRAEVLRERVRHVHVSVSKDTHLGVTLSIGVAAFPEHGADRDAIISAADAALYRAKRDGRDRVAVAEVAPRPDQA